MSATDPNIGAIGWQRDIMVWAGDVLLGAEQVDEPSLAVEAEVVEVLSSASDEDEAVEAEVAEGADEFIVWYMIFMAMVMASVW